MTHFKRHRPTLLALFLFGGLVLAQGEVLMTGLDSSGNVRTVLLDSAGRLVTEGAHGACVNTTMNVGTTGTACPASPSTSRGSILIQLVQSGETLTVTADGTSAATATVGAQIASGSTYSDDLVGTVSTSCRCSAATCSVRIVECP